MYRTILKNFSKDDIHLNDEQHHFLKILQTNLPRSKNFLNFCKKEQKKGCYAHGDVGRGKTMVLNSVFNAIKKKKQAFHYIEFMKFIHKELELVKDKENPLLIIAKKIASNNEVIFIDEFQVEDVSDAMILGKLLNLFSKMNIYLMLTSNASIEDLYKNGLQREKFIKQMQQLQKKLIVFEFKGKKDYRTRNIDLYSQKNENEMNKEQILYFIKKNFNFIGELNREICINDRSFICKGATKDFIWISYKDFFKQNIAISDFLVMCKNYEWFFIDEFQIYDDYDKDVIRRFIGFIDIAYLEKVKIKFFINYDDLKDLYAGKELSFLWSRTLSRLEEMRHTNSK